MPPVSSSESTCHLPLSVLPTRSSGAGELPGASTTTGIQNCGERRLPSRATVAHQPLVGRTGHDIGPLDELQREGREDGVRPSGVVVTVVLPGGAGSRIARRPSTKQAVGEVVDDQQRTAGAERAEQGPRGMGGIVEVVP